jgi:arylsulfatase A-like enzyme
MTRKKTFKNILFFISLWMILSVFFTFTFAPYKSFKNHRLFVYNQYNTILLSFQKTFWKSLAVSIVLLGLFYLGRFVFLNVFKRNKAGILVDSVRLFKSAFFKFTAITAGAIVLALNISLLPNLLRKGPNVLIVVVDTLRADYSAVGDDTSPNTPCLKNHLMPDSLSFKTAFSNSPWTLPSVASLLTSQYPSRLNITNLISRLEKQHLTLAEILKERGYKTCAVISHLLLQKKYGLDQGFQTYNEDNISEEFHNHYSISSPGITEDALQFIEKHKKKKFFLLLHYFDPHYIYINHDISYTYSGEFLSRDISYIRNLVRQDKYEDKDVLYLKHSYSSEIKFTDFYIGKVIDALKALNLYDKTLIVFTSDHGEEFLEKGWLGHSTTVYNEQIKIPLVIKLPSSKRSLEIKEQSSVVSNVDIAPTVLGVLGISRPRSFQGMDIFSDASGGRVVYSEVTQKEYGDFIDKACVTNGRWKLIKDFILNQYELYNLIEDKNETENRIGSGEDIERSLKMKIEKWTNTNRLQKRPQGKREALSEEEKKRLKSLGYIK